MLEKVIRQLPQEKFEVLSSELIAGKGEKLTQLLGFYRNGNNTESEILSQLNLNNSAYYTLRSRLFDKIRIFLFRDTEFEGAELLKNVHAIPFVIYNYPRETAIALLTHLESELIRLDMQLQLVNVYSGLKKLNLNSEKYYHYEKLYNKTVAFTLAQDKAEELLSIFCKTLSGYLLSGAEPAKEVLMLYLREIHNQTLLYESARLNLYHKMAYLNYVILADLDYNDYYPNKTTEELLKECRETVASFKQADFNHHLDLSLRLLSHRYYHTIKHNQQNQIFCEDLSANAEVLCNLNPVTCPGIFLLTLLEKARGESAYYAVLKKIMTSFYMPETDNENEIFYIYYHITNAGVYYEEENNHQCLNALQKLINYNFLKKYSRSEIEIKLFCIFVLLLETKLDMAENMLRSVTRKSSKESFSEPEMLFISILKTSLITSSSKQKKIFEAFRLFRLVNSSSGNALLSFINIKEKHILQLSMI